MNSDFSSELSKNSWLLTWKGNILLLPPMSHMQALPAWGCLVFVPAQLKAESAGPGADPA